MWMLADLHRFFKSQPWQTRIAYALMLLLATIYLVTQILMAVMWLAGEAPLDTV